MASATVSTVGTTIDERAGVERMLNLALIGVGHAHAGNRLRVRAGAPHACDRLPVMLIVLHLRPDEVVTGIRHGAVGGGIGGAEKRAAGHLAALHQLEPHRIPEPGARRRIERGPVLPGGGIEGPLIHRSWRGGGLGVTVLARRSRQRELCRPGCRVVDVGIGARWRLASARSASGPRTSRYRQPRIRRMQTTDASSSCLLVIIYEARRVNGTNWTAIVRRWITPRSVFSAMVIHCVCPCDPTGATSTPPGAS